MGLWYPEILNRLGSNNVEDAMTVCNVIDASIDQSESNQTCKVYDQFAYVLTRISVYPLFEKSKG